VYLRGKKQLEQKKETTGTVRKMTKTWHKKQPKQTTRRKIKRHEEQIHKKQEK